MSIDFLELQKAILTEHNRLRQDPSSYIPILEKHLTYFKGEVLYRPRHAGLKTIEGPNAYHQAIAFLKKQRPVDALTFHEELSKASVEHANDLGAKGLVSHESVIGKTVSDRVEQFVEWDQCLGENLEVGSKTAQDVIVSLLVDDGSTTKGNRVNMFKPEFLYVGIGCAGHKEYEAITVIDYVGGIREKGKPYFDYANFKYEYPKTIGSGLKDVEEKPKTEKKKNLYNDDDAPEGTVSLRILKTEREFKGKKIIVTKKFYKLENGTEHVVELEEF